MTQRCATALRFRMVGDWFRDKLTEELCLIPKYHIHQRPKGKALKHLVYLPSIGQLMGMIEKPDDFIGVWAQALNDKAKECGQKNGIYWYGMTDQGYWLAFVMYELHSLKWDGGKWRNDG